MELPVIDASVAGKKVFVRGDIDVPLSPLDDTRLNDIWPTVEFLLSQNCQIILAGHLGRPEGKVVPELSVTPVRQWFLARAPENLTVLENLRFDPREEANNEDYAQELASLADVYVNEAFAASERAHASIVGVPKYLPHFAGFRLAKEIEVLSDVLENPKRPLLVIIGGAKLETKLPLISKMAAVADTVIVGGKLLEELEEMDKIQLKKLEMGKDGKDVTQQSIAHCSLLIAHSATLVWNGPMGEVETGHEAGTRELVEMILAQKDAYKIVGGGDTVAFLSKLGLTSKFDWVSSGGGSMLKFLAGEKLSGLVALQS